jgi:hypothetical protein
MNMRYNDLDDLPSPLPRLQRLPLPQEVMKPSGHLDENSNEQESELEFMTPYMDRTNLNVEDDVVVSQQCKNPHENTLALLNQLSKEDNNISGCSESTNLLTGDSGKCYCKSSTSAQTNQNAERENAIVNPFLRSVKFQEADSFQRNEHQNVTPFDPFSRSQMLEMMKSVDDDNAQMFAIMAYHVRDI